MTNDSAETVESEDGAEGPSASGEAMWEWMRTAHLEPEIARRLATGEFEQGETIWMAQVLFWHDRAPQVRLNQEVQGKLEVEAVRAMEKGQEVTTEDMGRVSAFLLPEADGDAAHVTMLVTASGPFLIFDASYNAVRIEAQLRAADEFLAVAADCLEKGRLRTFAENAFGACELLAGAELLSLPDKRVMTRKHQALRSFYNQWARLENTDPRFAALLNRLAGLRTSGRYLRAEFELEEAEARETLTVLGEMREHVEAVRPQRTLDSRPTRAYKVFATREIRAGEMVAASDTVLFR
jgi:HEPN domain-containing protein